MISGGELGGLAASRLPEAQGAGTRPATPVAGPGTDAEAGAALQMQAGRWLAAIKALPDIRPEKVAAAAARLASGQAPTPTEVAAQILRRIAADRLAGS